MRYLLVLLLAGCHQAPMELHGGTCSKQGLEKDSELWKACVLDQHQQADDRKVEEDNRRRLTAATHQPGTMLQRGRKCAWAGGVVACK